MSDDSYIKYSGATEPYGIGYRTLRKPPSERVDALLPLLFELIQRNANPGENHICPLCYQEIKIAFEYFKEIPDELDISTFCSTCEINVFFKSNKIPIWAKAISIFDLPGFID